MPDVLSNTTTANAYPNQNAVGAAVFGFKSGIFYSGFIVVANAAAFCRIGHGITGQQPEFKDEIFLPPGTYQLHGTPKDPIAGIMFRSAVAGIPAQVFGVLYFPDEASILASSEFTTQVQISGGTGDITINPVYVQNWFANVEAAGAFSAADAAGRILGPTLLAGGKIDPLNQFGTTVGSPIILVTPLTGWYQIWAYGVSYSAVGNTMVGLIKNSGLVVMSQTVTITAGDQASGQGPAPKIVALNVGDFLQWMGWNTGGGNVTCGMGIKLMGVP